MMTHFSWTSDSESLPLDSVVTLVMVSTMLSPSPFLLVTVLVTFFTFLAPPCTVDMINWQKMSFFKSVC